MTMIHTSAYKFIPLNELKRLQMQLKQICLKNDLKGTIIISPEGINLGLAGEKTNLEQFKTELAFDVRFNDLFFKDTVRNKIPYKKMVVKIKPEAVTIGRPNLNLAHNEQYTITPEELKRWYDQGLEFDIIDTRNDYETHMGTFKQAIKLPLKHFRDFPEVISKYETLKANKRPKVIFCTGGIRCEKALPVMLELGFKDVYQLEGGIIHYLQKFQEQYYDGECFVFDEAVSLNANLQETNN